MFKAMALGAMLTATLALVIGSQGGGGGVLAIHPATIADIRFYWSWPIFIVGSGLSFGIILLMR